MEDVVERGDQAGSDGRILLTLGPSVVGNEQPGRCYCQVWGGERNLCSQKTKGQKKRIALWEKGQTQTAGLQSTGAGVVGIKKAGHALPILGWSAFEGGSGVTESSHLRIHLERG